jgi:hypothetical protein
MEVSGQLHPPATLPLEKELLVPLDRKLGGPQSQFSGCSHEERKVLAPAVNLILVVSL